MHEETREVALPSALCYLACQVSVLDRSTNASSANLPRTATAGCFCQRGCIERSIMRDDGPGDTCGLDFSGTFAYETACASPDLIMIANVIMRMGDAAMRLKGGECGEHSVTKPYVYPPSIVHNAVNQTASTVPTPPRLRTVPTLRPSLPSISASVMPCSSLSTNAFRNVATSAYVLPSKPLRPAAIFSASTASSIRCLALRMAIAGFLPGVGKILWEDGPLGSDEDASACCESAVEEALWWAKEEGEKVGEGLRTGPICDRREAKSGSRASRSRNADEPFVRVPLALGGGWTRGPTLPSDVAADGRSCPLATGVGPEGEGCAPCDVGVAPGARDGYKRRADEPVAALAAVAEAFDPLAPIATTLLVMEEGPSNGCSASTSSTNNIPQLHDD
ncbi:hypothetical protein FH972_021555 [Carpinus fangiana]|uniref:Uncharacterized protein n=1 Tax=Carpinus fangiana TaxID=176857 RepID=A0A5N6KQ09_9ROSI|nr:hypothetical protein FH972_021555 [Carpinus fangiana]